MKMKKILVLLISLVLVSGCVGSSNSKPGKVTEISCAKMNRKIADKETFIVVLEQEGCSYCKAYNKKLKKYVEDHHVEIFTIDLKKEKYPKVAYEQLKKKYKNVKAGSDEIVGTPHTLVFEKGKAKESLSGERETKEVNDLVEDYDLYIK